MYNKIPRMIVLIVGLMLIGIPVLAQEVQQSQPPYEREGWTARIKTSAGSDMARATIEDASTIVLSRFSPVDECNTVTAILASSEAAATAGTGEPIATTLGSNATRTIAQSTITLPPDAGTLDAYSAIALYCVDGSYNLGTGSFGTPTAIQLRQVDSDSIGFAGIIILTFVGMSIFTLLSFNQEGLLAPHD